MKAVDCMCGTTIHGQTVEDVMKNGMKHVKEAGQSMPTAKQLKEIKSKIRDE